MLCSVERLMLRSQFEEAFQAHTRLYEIDPPFSSLGCMTLRHTSFTSALSAELKLKIAESLRVTVLPWAAATWVQSGLMPCVLATTRRS